MQSKKFNRILTTGLLLLNIFFTGCNSGSKTYVVDDNKIQPDSVVIRKTPVVSFYNPIENYFSTIKPNKKIETVLDSIQFEKDFRFAATMNNVPAKINFSKENIGAIILPETLYETSITIQTARVKNDTLHIVYTIKEGTDQRSYSIVPVKLFAYNKRFNLVFDYQK